jgi:hypothetical protein
MLTPSAALLNLRTNSQRGAKCCTLYGYMRTIHTDDIAVHIYRR